MIYSHSSLLIAFVLFGLMFFSVELGFRVAKLTKKHFPESYLSEIDSVQTSLLGLLALLIAFTFSMALQRYDSRSDAVVDEANAIGTTYLRTQLLPIDNQAEIQHALRDYVDLRVHTSTLSPSREGELSKLFDEANTKLDQLWQYTMQQVPANANPATIGLFVQALNEMIDSFGRRSAVIERHVPDTVLGLLAIVFTMTSIVIGYNAGIKRQRPSKITYLMVLLIVMLVYAILDLDHPRQGLIKVSQKPLLDLQVSLNKSIQSH
jgi:SNF family Na+-dependent transporter